MCLVIHVRHVDGVCLMKVAGRLTLGYGVNAFRDTLSEMILSGEKNLLLDLGNLTHLDRTGIRALIGGFATVTSQRGQLKLLNLTTQIKDLLLMPKLLSVLESFDDESAAVGSFATAAVAGVVNGS